MIERFAAAGLISPEQAQELARIMAEPAGAARNGAIGDLATLALAAVATSELAPASARAAAGRALADIAGLLTKQAPPQANKPASEMTLAEIEARLSAFDFRNSEGDVV